MLEAFLSPGRSFDPDGAAPSQAARWAESNEARRLRRIIGKVVPMDRSPPTVLPDARDDARPTIGLLRLKLLMCHMPQKQRRQHDCGEQNSGQHPVLPRG